MKQRKNTEIIMTKHHCRPTINSNNNDSNHQKRQETLPLVTITVDEFTSRSGIFSGDFDDGISHTTEPSSLNYQCCSSSFNNRNHQESDGANGNSRSEEWVRTAFYLGLVAFLMSATAFLIGYIAIHSSHAPQHHHPKQQQHHDHLSPNHPKILTFVGELASS